MRNIYLKAATLLGLLILLLAPVAQARAKLAGLVGGTGYIEATLAGPETGWVYQLWAYDILGKKTYKSELTSSTAAIVTLNVKVPVVQRDYQVLVVQFQLAAPAPTPAPIPEVTPTPTPTPEPAPEVTLTPTPDAGTTISLHIRTKGTPIPEEPHGFLERMAAFVDKLGLFGGPAYAEEVPVLSDTVSTATQPAAPASGVIVLTKIKREDIDRLTLDPATGNIVMGDDATSSTVLDMTQAEATPPLNPEGNQLMTQVLMPVDTLNTAQTVVLPVEQKVKSVDILRSSFSEEIVRLVEQRFSPAELDTARLVLQALKDEALKDYDRQLQAQKEYEQKRAREQLLHDALNRH